MDNPAYATAGLTPSTYTSLANAFGISESEAAKAATTIADALSRRIELGTLSRGGVADIVALLSDPVAGRAIAEPKSLAGPDVAQAGNEILSVLLGDKHSSRGIAARAASSAGIDSSLTKRMLPVIASMMIGGLQRGAEPQLSRVISKTPALAAYRNGSPLPLPGEIPMQRAPSAPATNTPSTRRRGSSPLPVPGDDIPGTGRRAKGEDVGNDDNSANTLPDIIRRGGVQVPGGGSLTGIIRSILGGLLGFKNRGVVGNLIQALVLRWIINLVRRFFSRR